MGRKQQQSWLSSVVAVGCVALFACGSDDGGSAGNSGSGAGAGGTAGTAGFAGVGGAAGFAGMAGIGGAVGTGAIGGGGSGAVSGAGGQGGAAGSGGNGGLGGSGTGGTSGSGGTGGSGGGLPPTSDYGAKGPFDDVMVVPSVGPNNGYTLFRPGASLGRDGFKHPIAVWGNGIMTTPVQYTSTLSLIASHGIVVIACNDTMAERPCLSAGLDWLAAQNSAAGELQGKLDVNREATIGYSWGGGAAIDTADRPNVRATVSLHGMPPRGDNAFTAMHAPLLLFTSTGDSFVTAAEYVTPNYNASQVKTFYATLDDATAGHIYVIDQGAISCLAATLGTCQNNAAEKAPTVAWLRWLLFDDQAAAAYFNGDACTLCRAPWTMPQRKNW